MNFLHLYPEKMTKIRCTFAINHKIACLCNCTSTFFWSSGCLSFCTLPKPGRYKSTYTLVLFWKTLKRYNPYYRMAPWGGIPTCEFRIEVSGTPLDSHFIWIVKNNLVSTGFPRFLEDFVNHKQNLDLVELTLFES